jgi:ribosome-associated protein
MLLSDDEKEMICIKLPNKISGEGEFILTAQSERTQLMNKRLVTEKFFIIISKALTSAPKRRSTFPTKASVKKRIDEKRSHGYKKTLRKKSDNMDEG